MGAAIATVCILLLATLFGVLAYAGAAFAVRVATNRRDAWIAVRPDLSNVPVEYLPPAVRRLVARAEPALAACGFGLVACGHAPEFATWAAWSQVLFLNRATGERASVLGVFEPATQTDQAELIIATEFRGGMAVQTSAEGGVEVSGAASDSGQGPLDVPAALAEHCRRVAAAAAVWLGAVGPRRSNAYCHPRDKKWRGSRLGPNALPPIPPGGSGSRRTEAAGSTVSDGLLRSPRPLGSRSAGRRFIRAGLQFA